MKSLIRFVLIKSKKEVIMIIRKPHSLIDSLLDGKIMPTEMEISKPRLEVTRCSLETAGIEKGAAALSAHGRISIEISVSCLQKMQWLRLRAWLGPAVRKFSTTLGRSLSEAGSMTSAKKKGG